MAAKKRSIQTQNVMAAELGPTEASLLDVIDNVLNKGVVIRGEAILGVAGVDLIYLRLSALLCAADRVGSRLPAKKKTK